MIMILIWYSIYIYSFVEAMIKSIKTKILGSFAIIVLLLAMMAIFSFSVINSLSQNIKEIAGNDMKILESFTEMSFSVANRAKIARDYILFGEEEFKEMFLEKTEKANEKTKQLLQ